MAAGEDVDCPSAVSPPPSVQTQRSVHRALGGGAAADVLLWRRRHAAALVAAAATTAWFFFEQCGYSFLSLLTNSLLLLVTILFLWAKAASVLGRPLPPLPKMEISDEHVGRAAAEARVWVNRALAVARELAIERDRKVFFQVILTLWVVSYVGSFFNFLTLVYIVVILSLTVPPLYEKYQDHVDEKFGVVHGIVSRQYDNIVGKTIKQSNKEKKTQ